MNVTVRKTFGPTDPITTRVQHNLGAVHVGIDDLPGAGIHVRRWMEDGTLTRRGKFFAVSGLAFGLSMTILALHERQVSGRG
mgnify:CR=1 FL=1